MKENTAQDDNPKLFYFFCMLFSLLLLVLVVSPTYLPMVDLPQHAGQVAMWKQFDEGTLPNIENFERVPLINPYWGGYAIIRILSYIMPLMIAVRLTVFIALTTPLAALFYAVRKTPFIRWSLFLFIPFLFNWNFYWGFLNFIIAIGPCMFLLFIGVKMVDSKSPKLYWMIGLSALILFFFHILIALMYVGLISSYVLVKTLRLKHCLLTLAALSPFILLTLKWMLPGSIEGETEQFTSRVTSTIWNLGFHKITLLPTTMLSSYYYGETSALIAMWGTFIILAGAFYYGTINRERLLLFFLIFLAYLLLPQYSFHCHFLYERFAFLLIPFSIYAIADNRLKSMWFARLMQATSVLIPFLYLSSLLGVFFSFNEENKDFSKLLSYMEMNKRVLSLPLNNRARSVSGPVMLHFPLWYQATHGGLTEYNFGILIRYKKGHVPKAGHLFVWNPKSFNKDIFEEYDYYVIRYPEPFKQFPFEGCKNKFQLLHQEGNWHLYSQANKD